MSNKITWLLLLGLLFASTFSISSKVYKIEVDRQKNARVKEINNNVDQGLKTTNRILDLIKPPAK